MSRRSCLLTLSALQLAMVQIGCRCGTAVTHVADAQALGPYSASASTRELVFVSGKIGSPQDAFEVQAASALREVRATLIASGSDWDRVVNVTVYLTNIDDYASFNSIYSELVPAPRPARSVVAVAGLPKGARVEIAVTAARAH